MFTYSKHKTNNNELATVAADASLGKFADTSLILFIMEMCIIYKMEVVTYVTAINK